MTGDRNEIEEKAGAYLRIADSLMPGWIRGFYVVGSAALGEYVPGRSDLDFVAVVSSEVGRSQLLRARLLHALGGIQAVSYSKRRGGALTGGTPNGVFVRETDIARPVTTITPVASHTGHTFSTGKGFDVNPVVWKVLAERGITIRGDPMGEIGLDPQPDMLKQWNLGNLNTYWRRWGEKVRRGRLKMSMSGLRYGSAWAIGWGTLGAPRLHCTIATGDVIGKRTAGEYALDTFGDEWHDVVRLGLAWWHRETHAVSPEDVRRSGEFVLAVVDAANALG